MKTKKILSLVLCLIMLFSIVPLSANAASYTVIGADFTADGYFYDETYRYYYTLNPSYQAVFSGGTVSLSPSYSQIFSDSTCSTFLQTEPQPGGTYYLKLYIQDNKNKDVYFNATKENCSVDIKGFDATVYKVTNRNDYKYVEIIYELKMQPKKINSVAITNLDVPARGATPDTTATTEATFKIGSMAGIVWYRLENGSWKEMGSDEKFVAGKTYKCYFQILPTDGYIFPVKKDEFSVTINNEAANIVNFSSKLVYVEKEFFVPCISHDFITVDTKDVSCTEDGYTNYKCKACGELKTVIANSTGHNYEKISHMDATCGIAGYTSNKCSTCGDTKIDTIPATGAHIYKKADYTAPTCTENGVETFKCENCNDTKTENIPATGEHTKDGSVCTTCGYDASDDCSCKCHGNFFQKLIFMITNFFAKLFNPAKRVCECGAGH